MANTKAIIWSNPQVANPDVYTEDRIFSQSALFDMMNAGAAFDIVFIDSKYFDELDERSVDYFYCKAGYCDYEVAFEHAWNDILSNPNMVYTRLEDFRIENPVQFNY